MRQRRRRHFDVELRTATRRALTAALLLVVVPGAGCVERGDPIEPIKVGLLVPKSGGLAGLGTSWENAARLAAEQINSSGGLFDGREMVLLIADSKTDPGPAEQAAQGLIDDGVVALIGPASSGESTAVKPLAIAAEIPIISCCATAASLTADQSNNEGFFFRTAPNDNNQAKALAYLAAHGTRGPHPGFSGEGAGETLESCPELFVIYQDDDYGSDLAAGVSAEFADAPIFTFDDDGNEIVVDAPAGGQASGRVILSTAFEPGFAVEKDPSDPTVVARAGEIVDPIVTALEDPAGHDFTWNPNMCFVFVAYGEDGAAVFVEFHKRLVALETRIRTEVADPRYDPDFILSRVYYGPDGLNDPTFATNAGAFGSRLVGTVPTHAANNAYQKFENAFRARFATAPGNFTAQMFDATMILGLALTRAGEADGMKVRDALFEVSSTGQVYDGNFFGEMAEALLTDRDIDYVGPSGALDFDARGDVVGDYALWRTVSNGATYEVQETDFLPADVFSSAD